MILRKISAIDYRKLDVNHKKYREVLEENYELVDMVTYLEANSETGQKQDISYDNLPLEIKRKVDYTTITIIELRWDDMGERLADLQKIFKNLNSRGAKLSQQEIRNGVYICPFYDMLREINDENEDWQKIRGRENDKEEDIEMLLRLCTVEKNVNYRDGNFIINNYHSKYSDWMDEFSEEAMKMGEKEISHYKETLEDFFSRFKSTKVLGLKRALIESLFVVMEKATLNIEITDEVIDTILNAKAYKENSRQGMVQKAKMNERWKGTYEVLSKYVR